MSNAFVIIKMCYVHNQWHDISCATLYIGLHAKCPLFLSDINHNLIFPTDFRKILKYQISWKSFQWAPCCSLRADGQKESLDSHVEDKNRSSQFYERAKKAMDTKPITIIDVALLRARNTVYRAINCSDMALGRNEVLLLRARQHMITLWVTLCLWR